MKWVEVVEVVADVMAAVGVVAVAGRAGWVVPSPPVQAGIASVPVAVTGNHTWWVCLAIRRSVRSAVRRWCANDK